MKKIIALTIVICLFIATLGTLSGCSLVAKITGKTYITYVNASDYTVGGLDSDQDFEDILINWYAGSVNIYEYDGDTLVFKEDVNKNVNEDWQMRWAWWNASDFGKYYQIQYAAKGSWDFKDLKKDLTILIPKKYETLNHLSVTVRDECDINIYLPSISFKGDAVKGSPNVHLDAEFGNINAYFNDIDYFRMIGDGDKIANQYYRRLHANNIGKIDYVCSYSRAMFFVNSITEYAEIKNYAGDIIVECYENIRKLTTSNTIGTTFLELNTFNKLDMTSKDAPIGVEMHYKQKFVVTMSNYTEYGSNLAYKEPHFMGRIGYVPDDELKPDDPDDLYDVTHTGDTWRVRDGKDKYGRDIEVKVESGADVYFGSWQSVYSSMQETGVFNEWPSDPLPYGQDNNNENNNNQ